MKYLFAPGCALFIYKPYLIERLGVFLKDRLGDLSILTTCCRHTPEIPDGICVINLCPGCDRRYRENYDEPETLSLWEILASSMDFPFPDYRGEGMTIIDSCPTRDQDRIHDAVRAVAERMNITVIEPERTRRKSTCCGDIFYGKEPSPHVIGRMKAKAAEMPEGDIIVYCISCVKSMYNGGRRARYLLDLLFGEETLPGECDPDLWHGELNEFIERHSSYEESALKAGL